MKLLIFDIDGTLTHLAGATRRAFDAAYVELFGVHASIAGVKMHGRTDPLIFRDCFHQSGIHGDWEKAYREFRPIYVQHLPVAIASAPNAHLHAGVLELLAALSSEPDRYALALGTGNMEEGGRQKVGYFDLNKYFPVGGFGDDHHERTGILRDALRNAEAHWRRTFAPADTWVIGDTEYDVQSGKALGMMTMGVATGGEYSVEQLRDAGADVVFADLSDTQAVLACFNGHFPDPERG